jgi:hypothetical protein
VTSFMSDIARVRMREGEILTAQNCAARSSGHSWHASRMCVREGEIQRAQNCAG